ncbi:MAG TPA: hypothetical protein DIT64_11675 [Verrucomicrobiales bacterium]|nr:hypothetical protein [Verrucomicrobiales bacterium]
MDYYDPTAIVDNAGAVVERYRFSAFGRRAVLASDFSGRAETWHAWDFAFKGQFLDLDTGYYNYGYRYYSPELGRWLSRDPVGEEGGVNLYIITGNNPLNDLDVFGLVPTLSGDIISGPSESMCGYAKVVRRWQLSEATMLGGYVIQKVSFQNNETKCDGSDSSVGRYKNGFHYTEAWSIFRNNRTNTALSNDTFSIAFPIGGECTRGTASIEGTAQYFDGHLTLPAYFSPGNVLEARSLPSAIGHRSPFNSGGSNVIHFRLSVRWNCCKNSDMTNPATDCCYRKTRILEPQ